MQIFSQPIKMPIDCIKSAVNLWLNHPTKATARYGRIEEWDTSKVADMTGLFANQLCFNDDISRWDVANVTCMSSMFHNAPAFNQDLSGWDVSRVTDMSGMFLFAQAFNQNLNKWNVRRVTNMSRMFYYATKFNQDLSGWDVSSVTDMTIMFQNATSFNQDLGAWDVSSATYMASMFQSATSFEQDLSGWDVSHVNHMPSMFHKATTLTTTLQRTRNVSSFFDGQYRAMPIEERQKVFAGIFKWKRRAAFMIFLVNHGYIYSASVASNYEQQATKPIGEMVPCDIIFDVEDIARYICLFL